MKRVLLGVLVFLAVIAAVILLVPSLRLTLVGTALTRHLQVGQGDELSVMMVISGGNEIRPLTEAGLTIPTQNARPESYDLRLALQETVEGTGGEAVVGYRVTGVRSEQLGTTGGEGLTANTYRMRALPTGLVADLGLQQGHPSRILDPARFSEVLAAAWPALPGSLVRPGTTWSGRWDAPLPLPLLKEAPLVLQHRLRYKLVDFQQERDLQVARIQVSGDIVPAASGPVGPGLSITGTGRVEGTALLDVATGRTVLADDRTAWSVVVRDEGQGLEVVHFADRKARLWRPRVVPDGQAGFEASLPVPAGPGSPGTAPAPPSPAP